MRKIYKLLSASILGAGLLLGLPSVSPAQTGYGSAGGGSPTAEANKRIKELQGELNDLRAERTALKNKILDEFAERDEWKDTLSRHKKAKAAYDAAKKKAEKAVKASAAYKDLAGQRDALVAKQDELAKKGGADPDEVARVGTELAKKATALKNMEKEAIDQDEKALAAKEEFLAAEKEKRTLDAEVEDAMLSDPDFEQLESKIADAETQLDSAKDQLAQQKKAAAAQRAGTRAATGSGSGKMGSGRMGKGMGKQGR